LIRLAAWWRPFVGILLTLYTLRLTAWFFAILNARFLHNGVNYEESFFVWGGWSILKGRVPYRDFIEYKPPLLFLTHALAQKIFGFEHFEYRTFLAYLPLSSLLALQLALVSRRV